MIRFFVLLLLLVPSLSYAQLQDRLTIEIGPSFPESFTPLSLNVRSISLDLSRARISWFVNNSLVLEGEGETRASATTGALGTKTTITVEAEGEDGEFLSATRTIQPAEVDLVWESNSYAHPFYRGKRLASSGSSVFVEAIPQLVNASGAHIPNRDIVFTWRRNDAVVTAVSGRGKSSATFQGPELFGTDTVTVEAASTDSVMIAASTILIQSTEPFLSLYEDHPLFGILFHRAIPDESSFADSEVTLFATPYFAGVLSADDSRLSYAWRVNRAVIAPDKDHPSHITLSADGSDGVARVELSVSHATDYVMNAQGLWRLVLNGGLSSTANDLFGAPQQ